MFIRHIYIYALFILKSHTYLPKGPPCSALDRQYHKYLTWALLTLNIRHSNNEFQRQIIKGKIGIKATGKRFARKIKSLGLYCEREPPGSYSPAPLCDLPLELLEMVASLLQPAGLGAL